MKVETIFILLPFAATLVNVFTAILLLPRRTTAQPILREDLTGVIIENTGSLISTEEDTYELDSKGDVVQRNLTSFQDVSNDVDDNEEEDPMLQVMPGTDFKAYVRADIATFYRKEPGSLIEQEPIFNGQAGKFVNISPDRVSLYWDGPNGPQFTGHIGPFGAGGTSPFPTHKFIITKYNVPSQVICRFTLAKGTSVYYCDPFHKNDTDDHDPAHGEYLGGSYRSLTELNEQDRKYYEAHRFNIEFGETYKNFTGGSEWLAMYPPSPPKHKIWRADYFGQTHTLVTKETQFNTIPPPEEITLLPKKRTLSITEMKQNEDTLGYKPFAEYRAPGTMNITVKALSCAPRAFELRNFLSDAEVDHILDLVHKKSLHRSTTGQGSDGQVSETRTSSTTWLPRNSDPILNVIFRRVADVLRMDEALFRERDNDELSDVIQHKHKINEDLQIVHYDVGQQYTAHHDFSYQPGVPGSKHDVRSINLCMYLNDTPKGGQTSFPRWRNAETGKSLDVTPEKGKAMIFYMINPDGNLDDLTQHAALPVIEGEKYFANLWIHSY